MTLTAAIFTYHFSDNYGALFQAYSLREWLQERGIAADFVNYHPRYVEEGGPLDRPWDLRLWRKNATIVYMWQAHLRRKLFGDRQQKQRFEHFRKDILGVSGPRLFDASSVASSAQNFDMLFCGSDQIWNPSVQKGLDPVYFLHIPELSHTYKVAYAPSFGRGAIEPAYQQKLYQLASKLDGISVREKTGLDVLETAGISRDSVQVVPDPTILLGQFDALLAGNSPPDASVFCYALRTDEVIRSVASQAAKLTGGKLRSPRTTHQRWGDIGEGISPGPVEWLRTLAQAGVVVSNSFHGVALSVVLNRPFIAVALPGKRAKMNARVQNLLTIAGLTDRILDTDDPERVRTLVETPIDWHAVNARLAAVRTEAERYLDDQIARAKEKCV